jgi:hypothetical protein
VDANTDVEVTSTYRCFTRPPSHGRLLMDDRSASSQPISWPASRGTLGSDDEGWERGHMMASFTTRHGARSDTPHTSTRRDLPALQPSRSPPRRRRKHDVRSSFGALSSLALLLFAFASFIPLTTAVFINFDNCLDRGYRAATPVRLQFVPLHVWAVFNTSEPSHNLNITVFGNVTGQSFEGVYPPPGAPSWNDPNNTFGKIVDVDKENNHFSTLISRFKVVTFDAYTPDPSPLCESVVNQQCPLGPAFPSPTLNVSDPKNLPGFTVANDFYSSYSFGTFASTMTIISGNKDRTVLGCVSANITPDLGTKLAAALCWLPAAVLILVAIATVFAATCSPWGSSDIFRWSSNYGRDEDLLRLVTPGFGDCLQYIQFIVLAGSLNLQYPGYFQPVVSQASWSILLFNESIVSTSQSSQSLVDGIYFANGTYGLSRLGQYIGMAEEQDIWACMAVWLLGLVGVVTVVAQIFFFVRWCYRSLTNNRGGDLREKNWPFTIGNIIRIMFNYFMLPIISLSLFQLVTAPESSASVVGPAVILLLGVMGSAAWIFWFIFTTRPRAHLFDDLPTVLTYGPLYNTYSDDAAPFSFIPVLLTTVRGIAIGAIQPSGIAQIIILAICEVILILTLNAFRPFQSNTSMNAYHTFFSAIRLASVLLLTAFVPSLDISEASKGWIGYVILLLHAGVLVFGFFLNALQTLIEVAARLGGAGANQRGGLTKVFGKRQLSRRTHRHQRSSLNSNAALLAHNGDHKSIQLMGGRARSMSASSAILLDGGTSSQRASVGFDQFSQGGDLSNFGGGTSPGTPGINAVPWSHLSGSAGSRRPTVGGPLDNPDPYYRPPRPRKQTMDSMTPGNPDKMRTNSADLDIAPYADNVDRAENGDIGEGPSSWSPDRSSITPAYLRLQRDNSDPTLAERHENTDYSVRESDFYYGLRGPSLSAKPSRKLKTGPADPIGPVSTTTGWFKSLNLFGGKKVEKGKGFEVVRSHRMPPQMVPLDEEEDESPHVAQEPYRDSPPIPSDKRLSHEASADLGHGVDVRSLEDVAASDTSSISGHFDFEAKRIPDLPPSLGPIEMGDGIELPSRVGSRASKGQASIRAPTLPRKSSRRTGSTDRAILDSSNRLSTVTATPPGTPARLSAYLPPDSGQHLHPNAGALPIRLPFGSTEPSPERSPNHSTHSSIFRTDASSDMNQLADTLVPPQMVQSSNERPLNTGYVAQHVARDSIHKDEPRTHLEASAEFVDRSRSNSTQGTRKSRS